ncbi:antifungal protein ginkbilobin-2-like [Dorcoceras hygrometricum]|uniref:Antifungal protein ginkbilobin-2-like n=1 Tax=Dorcoceras hygrometricum TaxID=472368 RepID=A0A2Z7BZ83_9LAMI|nr:antifungal protein ginkbilobin-2-like [Dorcoceras hygrometricum]
MVLPETPIFMTIPLLICIAGQFLVAQSEPNTSVNLLWCNLNGYSQEEVYASSVADVLMDLVNVTPNLKGFKYRTVAGNALAVSFGHATCNEALSNVDCADCLSVAKDAVTTGCRNSVGGRMELVDCGIRYENYPI